MIHVSKLSTTCCNFYFANQGQEVVSTPCVSWFCCSCRSVRLNEFHTEGFLLGRARMAGLLRLFLLLSLQHGSVFFVSASPEQNSTASASASAAALTPTDSLYSAGKTSTTEGPTTGSSPNYTQSTTRPPHSSTTTKPGTAGKSSVEAASRKVVEEEGEEGPLELGEWFQLHSKRTICYVTVTTTMKRASIAFTVLMWWQKLVVFHKSLWKLFLPGKIWMIRPMHFFLCSMSNSWCVITFPSKAEAATHQVNI